MPWVKIDDGFTDHAKVEALSDRAFRLHVAGLCFCARMLTDGIIPEDRVRRLLPNVTKGAVKELLDGDVWRNHRDGYEVVSYLDYNPSKEKVENQRAATAERKAKFLARKAEEERKKNASKNAVPNASGQNGAPAQPDPTQPVGHWVGVGDSQANPSPSPSAGDDEGLEVVPVEQAVALARGHLKPVPIEGPDGSTTCPCDNDWSACDTSCPKLNGESKAQVSA